jgi:hypothetical protein
MRWANILLILSAVFSGLGTGVVMVVIRMSALLVRFSDNFRLLIRDLRSVRCNHFIDQNLSDFNGISFRPESEFCPEMAC